MESDGIYRNLMESSEQIRVKQMEDVDNCQIFETCVILYQILDTTAMNPQFHIQIPRSGAAKCHVVVSQQT